MDTDAAGGPLSGVRVLDLTNNLSGPFATMLLAQQGADVIKVERPPTGDIIRGVGSQRGGVAAYFVNANWGKRSIALDLSRDEDRATLGGLIGLCDVLVENFRPSVMPGFGLEPRRLIEQHTRLIYAAIRGFPSTSSRANEPAYDHVIQAETGFASCQADLSDGTPSLVQQAVVDKVTGLTAAQAITAALFERTRTDRGQFLEISMMRAALQFLWPDVATNQTLVGNVDTLPPQSRTYRLTKTADGYVAMIPIANDQFEGLLRATGMDHLVGDPKLSTPGQRGRHGAQVMRDIVAVLGTKSTDDVVQLLTAHGVPCGRVIDLHDVVASADRVDPGFMNYERHPEAGELVHPGPAVTFDESVKVRPAPAFGEHTDEIRREIDGT
jgi:crotonobetainyl-CoA:carnitine CoA-transferase CaiB-like acyl-CoA transferase